MSFHEVHQSNNRKSVRDLVGKYPVITITGPRQSGKTTLCRRTFAHKAYANLESPDVRQFAVDDPRGFLAQYPQGAVFDEIQRAPELTSYLQPMIDSDQRKGQYTRDYFKGLRHFAKLFPDHIPWGSGLVYSGNETQERTDVSIVPFQHLNRLFSHSQA
jgi:hypothetical protein